MKGLLSRATSCLKRSSPTILTCLSVAGFVGTTVLAVRATPKALAILDEATVEYCANGRTNHDDIQNLPKRLPFKETVQLTWKCYIPAALVGLSTVTCIVGINALSKRNQASLASAYAMLSESYQQYRKAANVVYGEDADSKIKAQMAKDTYVSADGYSVYDSDLDLESERILCYDLFSRRYFTATMAAVLNAQYHLNRNLCLRGNVSVNEFYEFLGIDKIEHGDDIGWSMDELMEGGVMWLDFENGRTQMDDGLECCVISALWEPNKFCFEDR
jgi:hypothetical protein|nr:MAG TPA: hypothetical protein [Caudoviricetes sp.]